MNKLEPLMRHKVESARFSARRVGSPTYTQDWRLPGQPSEGAASSLILVAPDPFITIFALPYETNTNEIIP